MAESSSPSAAAPGVLYFDPNPTTSKLATAGLRLAGFQVFNAASEEQAVALCRAHGPAGDASVAAILLDASTSPRLSAAVLRALVQVPGADELPGILLVSRANPTPIPGAEALPFVQRPFTTPVLLKVLRETIDAPASSLLVRGARVSEAMLVTLEQVLKAHLPKLVLPREAVRALASDLVNRQELPALAEGVALQADVARTRIESVLQMLGEDGVRGVLTVVSGKATARLHLDRGRLRMAEMHDADEDLRLGRFIVQAGFMIDDALEAIVRKPDAKHRPLGIRLVEEGHLQPEEIAQALVDQAREVTCHLLTWKQGQVTFAPSDELHPLAATTAGHALALRISDALLEGLRRADEKAEMGPHMAGLDEVWMRVDHEIARRGRQAFTRDELGVLEFLNGRNNVKDIARKTRTGTFAVSKLLYRLSRAGLVRRRLNPVQV